MVLDDAFVFANENYNRDELLRIEPGESQTLILPFKVNKNALKDQTRSTSSIPPTSASRWSISQAVPPTAFGCKRPPPGPQPIIARKARLSGWSAFFGR